MCEQHGVRPRFFYCTSKTIETVDLREMPVYCVRNAFYQLVSNPRR
jgi:hypothetical protein